MSGPVATVAVFALFALSGLGVLAVLGVARSPGELCRRAGLAPLTGIAFTGIVAATLATAGSRLGISGFVALTALVCTAGGARLVRGTAAVPGVGRGRLRRAELAVVAVAVTTLAVVCASALAAFRGKPLAEYDGWAIWGMKARAIATIGSADPHVFASPAYERLHLEYPLLLPAVNSLPLQAAEGYSSNTVLLSCLGIGLAGLFAIWALLHDRVRPVVLLPFVVAIAAAPAFFGQLRTGYADVPLAVLVAAGLGAGALWLVEGRAAWLGLLTLFFAAAVLTKNEGTLFAAALYVPLLLVAQGKRRAVLASGGVVALAYAPWMLYTRAHDLEAPDYDLSSTFDISWVAGRLDRAPGAAAELVAQALDPRRLGFLVLLGLFAVVVSLARGSRPLGLLAGGFALSSIAGLTWIYVLSPYDLSFYLSTNSDRVVVAPVIGLATLAPLLLEECARRIAAEEGDVGAQR